MKAWWPYVVLALLLGAVLPAVLDLVVPDSTPQEIDGVPLSASAHAHHYAEMGQTHE